MTEVAHRTVRYGDRWYVVPYIGPKDYWLGETDDLLADTSAWIIVWPRSCSERDYQEAAARMVQELTGSDRGWIKRATGSFWWLAKGPLWMAHRPGDVTAAGYQNYAVTASFSSAVKYVFGPENDVK